MTPEGPGRPPIGPMVNIRLPQELIEGLDRMARSHDLSRAALIRIVLDDAVQGHRTKHLIQRLLGTTAAPVAEPKRGTVRHVYHETTREKQREAICRHCGRDIETGWGYWTHSDDPSGRAECSPDPTGEADK